MFWIEYIVLRYVNRSATNYIVQFEEDKMSAHVGSSYES